MIDDVKHSPNDLFDEGMEENDVSTDSETTNEDDSGESSDLLDDLPSERERIKNKQIEAHVRKVQEGKISLEDLESDPNLSWLVPHVQEQITKSKKGNDKEELMRIAREEARKILEEERKKSQEVDEEKEFLKLKSRIQSVSLTKDQKQALKNRYESLVDKVGRLEALTIAAEAARVDFEDDIEDRKKQFPGIKAGWSPTREESIDFSRVDPNKLSSEDRQKYVMAKKYGNQNI